MFSMLKISFEVKVSLDSDPFSSKGGITPLWVKVSLDSDPFSYKGGITPLWLTHGGWGYYSSLSNIRPPYLSRNCVHIREVAFGKKEFRPY